MSRRAKIIWSIIFLLAVAVGAIAFWQRDNIGAMLMSLRLSQEELEERLEQNDLIIKDAVAQNPQVTVRDVTAEEKQALKDGTLTSEELVKDLITKPVGNESGTPPTQPTQQPSDSTSAADIPDALDEPSEYEQEVSAIVAEVYVLREEFLIKLDNLLAEAIAEYRAIPAKDRTVKKLGGMVSRYMAAGLELEKQCDARIEEIIVELEALLEANGGDLSLAQTVYDTYVNEKSLKKAWYMSKLEKRGLI